MESWGCQILRCPSRRPSSFVLTLRAGRPLLLRCFTTTTARPRVASPHRPQKRAYLSAAGKKAKAGSDPTVMTTAVELATVPSVDTPQTCIHVRHDKRHYVFGRIAEGTQRAFGSRKISLVGVTEIFLSGSVGWGQVGGLVGFLLTVAGAATAAKDGLMARNQERAKKGHKPVNMTPHEGVGIHAGDNISHTLASQRSVIFRQPIRARLSEHRVDPRSLDPADMEPDWQDGMVKVWKIPATRARSSSPRKRRRASSEKPPEQPDSPAAEGEFKEARALSDPEVARIIVEHLLFNGDLEKLALVPQKVGSLQPEDIAFVMENGVLRKYGGPYPEECVQRPDPDDTAWVLPVKGSRKLDANGEKPWSLETVPLPKTSYSSTSFSYICKTHDRRGKFDRAAAEALGVVNHDFKHLIAGKQVQGRDGKTVTQDMVLGDRLPGRGFIVADIASRDFLDSFFQRPEWSDKELLANIAVMYWLLGRGMSSEPRIQKFMQDHPDIQHVICAPDTCPNMISNPGSAAMQMMLRRVDPERFPIPSYDNAVKVPAPPADSHIQFARAGKKIQIMPRLLFEDDNIAPFPDLVAPWNSVPSEVLSLAEQATAKASDPTFLAKIEEGEKDIPNRDAEIVCLGTGSSVPSKHRNVSGTLLRVPGVGSYLFDCGEGTIGQIRRLYGDRGTAEILRDLKCVVISHLHADHHLGALSVFREWYEQTLRDGSSANLAVSCIHRYRQILHDLAQVEDFGFHRLCFPNCQNGGADLATQEHMRGQDLGLAAIKRIPVPHCWRSMATEIELTSGLRVAYSGDCRPTPAFAAACRGAHLLIHECTFADDMADHAAHKMHSTMSEALGVARDMQARRTLLTHFSQRYVKSDSLRWEQQGGEELSVLLGFDFMSVKLGDFQKAACYLPALEMLMEKMDE